MRDREEDPLASPTLAQLYVTQGHYARAAKVLDVVLESEPFNGHALALRTRLEQRKGARIEVEREGDTLRIQYEHALDPDLAVHVVVAAWSRAGGQVRAQPMRSLPCATRRGRVEVAAPAGPGSACACLATLDPGGPLRVLAVTDTVTW